MVVAALVPAALAALVHVYVFVLESLRFVTPGTMRTFGIRTVEEAETMRPWACNQGFDNLFLAVEVLVGVVVVLLGHDGAGGTAPAQPGDRLTGNRIRTAARRRESCPTRRPSRR